MVELSILQEIMFLLCLTHGEQVTESTLKKKVVHGGLTQVYQQNWWLGLGLGFGHFVAGSIVA